MKRIGIILLLFISVKSIGQTTGHLRFDTVRIYKQGGTAELYLINSTKDSLGVLTNVGGGLTRFLKSRMLNDSVLVVGRDTLTIVGNLDRVQAANGLTKSGNTILLGGVLDQATNLYFNGFDVNFINGLSGTNTHHSFTGTGSAYLALDPLGNQTKVGIGTSSPTVKFDVNGIGLIRDPSVGFEFSGWPTSYNTGFNHNVLGVYGDEPSLDILIDSGSQFQIGGLTFRTLKAAAPKLPTARFGFGAGGKIEYNAFLNGLTWTSTMEFYLGDIDNNTIHVFAVSGPGTHFFGDRKVFTAESKEALMFGTAIKGVNSGNISALADTTYFAGDAGNKPMWWFNMPTVAPDTSTYRMILQHKTNGSVYAASYWPATGGGGGGGDASTSIGSSTDGQAAVFDGTTGKLLKAFTGSGLLSAASGVVSGVTTSAGVAADISDETGSGALVFGTAPTFITNITSPLVIGGTTTSAILNLKSTTGAGATDEVNILTGNNGAVTAAKWMSNGQQQATNGTAGAPGYTFAGQQNMGMYRSASNVLGLSAAGNAFTLTGQTFQFGTWANGITNNILGTNAGAGTTNRAANGMRIAAGQGTGNGAASYIALEVGTTGSSGTSLNALQEIAQFTTNGLRLNVINNGSATDSVLTVSANAVRKVASAQTTYTPTLTGTANVDAAAVTGTDLYYERVGNFVTVRGVITVDPTTAGITTTLRITLPIASALTATQQLSGQGIGSSIGATFGTILADATNDAAEFNFINGSATSSTTYSIWFSYEIL